MESTERHIHFSWTVGEFDRVIEEIENRAFDPVGISVDEHTRLYVRTKANILCLQEAPFAPSRRGSKRRDQPFARPIDFSRLRPS